MGIIQMKILLFSTNFLPYIGGAELALKEITDRIGEFSFDLITSRLEKKLPAEEKIGNIRVFRVGNKMAFLNFLLPKFFFPIPAYFKARKLSKKFGPYDMIFALQASQGAGAAYIFKLFNKKIPFGLNIQEGKDLEKEKFSKSFFRKLIIKKADIITVISEYLKLFIFKIKPGAKIEIIPNGINPEKFNSRSSNLTALDMLKEKLGIKMDERVIITVSRLVPKNGVRDIIGAMPETIKKIPNAKLLIIGRGKLEKDLRDQVRELSLGKNVLMIGEVENDKLPDYLLVSDVFVRPSLSEGLGTAFLEAMAAGVPIIGTPVGGITDFLIDRQTGLFCKVGNSKDLADKIVTLLTDKELRSNIIRNAKELVSKRYNWDNIANEFKKLCLTIR